jgi:hypothetical protein
MAQEEPTVAPLDEFHYFVTPIYITKQPQFLEAVKAIAADSIKQVHGKAKPNKIYPVLMSGNMLEDERIAPFAEFVGQTAWNILSSQGYAMDSFNVVVDAVWTQEHHKHSLMEQHVHGGGHQLVGFYAQRPAHVGFCEQSRPAHLHHGTNGRAYSLQPRTSHRPKPSLHRHDCRGGGNLVHQGSACRV